MALQYEYQLNNKLSKIESLVDSNRNLLDKDYSLLLSSESIIEDFDAKIRSYLSKFEENNSGYHSMLTHELDSLESLIKYLIQEVKRIKILNILDTKASVSIIVGTNGSGKSSLADNFKKSFLSNVIVIPARKYLYFETSDVYGVNKIMDEDSFLMLQKSLLPRENEKKHDQFHAFTNSIITIINEHIRTLTNNHKNKTHSKSKYELFQSIWKKIIPEIEIEVETTKRELLAIKNGSTYNVNELSDGEKSIIFYIIQILLAPADSYIIVDEPEIHLSNSLASIIWNELLNIKSNSKFIFISHDLNFITTFSNHQLIWCKSFVYPDSWDLQIIDKDLDIPSDLIIELVGSKKKILFCEGDDKSSLDYKVYNILFNDKYNIIPVGGHNEVKKYTDLYNKTTSLFTGQKALGIIDGDYWIFNQDNVNVNNIFILPFNEIEMFLLEVRIINAVLTNTTKKVNDSRQDFVDEFFRLVSEKKEQIVIDQLTLEINNHFSTEGLLKSNNLTSLKTNYNRLIDLDIDSMYNELELNFNQIIRNNNYLGLLKICNLKKEISHGLANSKIDNNYIEKAIRQLELKKELRDYLVSKYFNGL